MVSMRCSELLSSSSALHCSRGRVVSEGLERTDRPNVSAHRSWLLRRRVSSELATSLIRWTVGTVPISSSLLASVVDLGIFMKEMPPTKDREESEDRPFNRIKPAQPV